VHNGEGDAPVAPLEATASDRSQAVRRIAMVVVAILAGLALLAGIAFAWLQLSGFANRMVAETLQITNETLRINGEMLRISQERHLTEQYSSSLDQLGNQESVVVRVGGIYALGRLAESSPGDHRAIADILIAYLRQQAPVHDRLATPAPAPPEPWSFPRADTQAALAVLQRLKGGDEEQVLDLHNTDLRGVHLPDAGLKGVDLAEARLQGADLTGANLADAHLENASLSGSTTLLQGINLRGAFLERSDLRNAHLEDADLRRAELDNESERAGFEWMTEGADLRGAHVQGANFDKANLTGACLQGVNLSQVVGLNQRQLDSALTDVKTIPPPGLEITPDGERCSEREDERATKPA
jgi:uncharacterized protein YjbI with pentapeptide repeats